MEKNRTKVIRVYKFSDWNKEGIVIVLEWNWGQTKTELSITDWTKVLKFLVSLDDRTLLLLISQTERRISSDFSSIYVFENSTVQNKVLRTI